MTNTVALIVAFCISALPAFAAEMPVAKLYTSSIGMKLVRIEPGRFVMGFEGNALADELLTRKGTFGNGDFDEHPKHPVAITRPFYIGACEVTNAQYEQFDPAHKIWRGRNGYSKADNEAVIFVSWYDATKFCRWLSKKENLPYRLPTEAEWEYACRAGTNTPFYTGAMLPKQSCKDPKEPLTVGRTQPNHCGLYDMHGNVEEWCYDWYGPYESDYQLDPVGRADGNFKVARGGSHSTEAYYLRSANRSGSLPQDRQWLIGFRVVIGKMPKTRPHPKPEPQRYQQNVSRQKPPDIADGPDPDKPYFEGPRVFIKIPQGSKGPLFSEHNHFTAVTECPNGDLMAAWFTCMDEMGRELGIAASRLRFGKSQWEPASPFWDAPDRNDHTQAFWHDGKGTLYHFNGLGVLHRSLAILLRKSPDNGVTWSKARLIFPDHGTRRNTVVESIFRAHDGRIILPMDKRGGSGIAVSGNEGKTWTDPGGIIRGTHAGVVQLKDGRLLAFGRHGAINGKMPMSISADMGKTWTYKPSPWQTIHAGRRVALMRLSEGPIFFASFCHEMMVKNSSGGRHPVTGLFAAVSTDEGKTWSCRRLVTDDGTGREIETMDGDPMIMDRRNAEPVGYLALCQGPNGIIHLLSSRNHYSFNLAWLKSLPPAAPPPQPPPKPQLLPVKHTLPNIYKPNELPTKHSWKWNFRGSAKESDLMSVSSDGCLKIDTKTQQQFWLRTERPELFGQVDPKKGFTAEIRTQVLKSSPDQRGVDFELYDGAGSRYAITVTDAAVYWYDGLVQSSAFLPFKQYTQLAQGLDNTDTMHTYRLAVRPDRVVQIYRDAILLGVRPHKYRTPRYPYVYIGAGAAAEALVEYVGYDLNGAAQPE